jgi:hypothetical protein
MSGHHSRQGGRVFEGIGRYDIGLGLYWLSGIITSRQGQCYPREGLGRKDKLMKMPRPRVFRERPEVPAISRLQECEMADTVHVPLN